jgi:hypothetical protein
MPYLGGTLSLALQDDPPAGYDYQRSLLVLLMRLPH